MKLNWLVLMAWRDSRRNISRLLLFISSVILGIAALVSIFSLSETLTREIDNQAAELIGADMRVNSNKSLTPALQKWIDSIPADRSEQRSFASMVYFPKNGSSRLIQVKALEGAYPYFGKLETLPEKAAIQFQQEKTALVDNSLLMQFGIRVGDTVNIGEQSYRIAGSLLSAPGQTGIAASVAPVVYIPLSTLSSTGLEQKGSRISYTYFFKLADRSVATRLAEQAEQQFRTEGINIDTIDSEKERTARSFRDLSRFLSLIGFIALLLGCIGVASAIHIHVREKISSIAVLRCLGATSKQAFLIFLIQILIIGILGSLAGVLLGNLIHLYLPQVLKDLLPVDLHPSFSWDASWKGLVLGTIVSVLFALAPLVSIRNISPLNTLRLSYQDQETKDKLTYLIYLLIVAFILLFARLQLRGWVAAVAFTTVVLFSFGMLTLLAKTLMAATRRFFPKEWSYLWRQGLSNLYRPNNQTTVLLVSIGLGTTLVSTLILTQAMLLNSVQLATSGSQPNVILFDIQDGQREQVMQTVRSMGYAADNTVPIVNMRLVSINQINASTLEKDSTLNLQRWVFSREYRVTYRDSLVSSERITKGEWKGRPENGITYVSMEEGYAKRNSIQIGDTLLFNVQGTLMETIVGSFRSVEWNRVQTNFLVVFPAGVLESAPKFHVLLTKVPTAAAGAAFQQTIVREYPNISVIDLGQIINVLNDILQRIGFVIRFMAGFCIITGMVLLVASVLISKYQRMQESVLLRTLGAARKQVYAINAIEYFFIGALAATTGIILSMLCVWLLSSFSFEMDFRPSLLPIIAVFVSICLLTVLIGLMNIRMVVSRSPLEILRQE